MLFSGGVDSTYSLISNLDLKPRLIMYWGIERHPYPRASAYWENVIRIYSEFASEKGLVYHPVKTNVLEVLHEMRIEHDFHKQMYNGSLWRALQHSLYLLPFTAPLSMGRFDRLIIASSHNPKAPAVLSGRPNSQGRQTDEKIAWANLRVKHDGYIHKFEKTKAIKYYLQDGNLTLRVCLNHERAHTDNNKPNCSSCEKCFRTIILLLANRIDPNICGFKVDSEIYSKIRHFIRRALEGKEKKLSSSYIYSQKMIPDNIDDDFQGSKKFLEWFKELDLRSASSDKNVGFYRDLYNKLPFSIAKFLDKFYTIRGIHIHGINPVLPKNRKQWKTTKEVQKLYV